MPQPSRELTAKRIADDMVASIRKYQVGLPSIPPEQALHVEFEQLVDLPKITIGRILDFLDLPPVQSLDSVQAPPRKPIDVPKEVDAVARGLADALRTIGYKHSSLAS